MSWVLGSVVCGLAISVGEALQIYKKRTPYLIILTKNSPSPRLKRAPCKVCVVITDVSLKCCDHSWLFIWHWIKGAQNCVLYINPLFVPRLFFRGKQAFCSSGLKSELFMMYVWCEGYVSPSSCCFLHKISSCFVCVFDFCLFIPLMKGHAHSRLCVLH